MQPSRRSPAGPLRLPDLIREWLVFLGDTVASPHTLRAYKSDILAFAESPAACGHTPWRDRGAILQWLQARMAAGDAPATVRRRLASLRAFLRWLADTGRPSGNPTFKLDSYVPAQTRVSDCLEESEVVRLKLAAETKGRPWAGLAVRLLYDCGLRVSEACAASSSDINTDGYLLVRGKGKRERLVPMFESLALALRSQDGLGVGPEAVRAEFRRLGRIADIKQTVRPHLLRASIATHLARRGVHSRTIQLFLGHRALTTTERYLRLDLRDVKAALAMPQDNRMAE